MGISIIRRVYSIASVNIKSSLAMKETLILILLIISQSISYCQNYHNFPTSQDFPLWGVKETKFDRIEDTETYRYFIYTMIGDTIIDQDTYSKVFELNDTLVDISSSEKYICSLRESDDSCI